jgi:hypothetical protein
MPNSQLTASPRGWPLTTSGPILFGFIVLAWAYGLVLPPFENLLPNLCVCPTESRICESRSSGVFVLGEPGAGTRGLHYLCAPVRRDRRVACYQRRSAHERSLSNSTRQAGDEIADALFIPVTNADVLVANDYRVGVGLYEFYSGQRLQAVQAGQALPDNVVVPQTK